MAGKKKAPEPKPEPVEETSAPEPIETQDTPNRRLTGEELRAQARQERRERRLEEKGY